MVVKIPVSTTNCVVSVDDFTSKWLNNHHKYGFGWEKQLSMEYEYSQVKITTKNGRVSLLKKIIAEQFLQKPAGQLIAATIDGSETNLELSNLSWITPKENFVRKMNTERKTRTEGIMYFGGGKYILRYNCHGVSHRHVIKNQLEAEVFKNMISKEFEATYT